MIKWKKAEERYYKDKTIKEWIRKRENNTYNNCFQKDQYMIKMPAHVIKKNSYYKRANVFNIQALEINKEKQIEVGNEHEWIVQKLKIQMAFKDMTGNYLTQNEEN